MKFKKANTFIFCPFRLLVLHMPCCILCPTETQDQRAVEAVLHTVLNLVLPLPRSQMGANAATHNPMQIKLVAIS